MKHTLQLLILFSLIGLFENCSKKKADIFPINPIADFSYEIKDWTVVTFTNKSENATKYLWDFGDGQTSIEKDPVHTYIKAGEYKVKLTAESIDGNKSTKILDVIIIDKALDARFTLNATSYDTPCVVNFKNESTVVGQYFEWDFGDGSTSTSINPMHVFPAMDSSYRVCLKVNHTCGIWQYCDTIFIDTIVGGFYGKKDNSSNPINWQEPQNQTLPKLQFKNVLGNNYPNPFNGQTQIDYELIPTYKKAKIELTNQIGQVVKTINLYGVKGSVSIEKENMHPGMYYYSLVVDEVKVANKIMVIK